MAAPSQRRLIFAHIDEPGYTNDLPCYLKHGGYEIMKKAFTRKPEELIDEVKKSGLRGRGGAGFPCGVKWGLVDRKSGKPIYLIVNADESEPGTFKDRYIMHQDPHQLIEGTMISCFANNVKQAYIYIRGEMPHGARILEKAIAEARAANFVGQNILGTNYSCEIYVHRGAGAYICGEETGLIESLEGKRANPRIKPPYFPAVLGLYQCPTIVNNVETLCHVKYIVDMGGEAYTKIGTPNNTGTRIFCVSGHVQKPGYYEFEAGKITMGQLLNEVCGGPLPGRTFKAVIPGGSSAKILRFGERFKGKRKVGADMVDYDWGVEDVPMDFDSLGMIGTMGGSGGVIVMDDTVNMVEALANINAFYSHESCGQCTPCREGSLWMKKITTRMVHGEAREQDTALLKSVADQIPGRTICAFGEACSWPTQSFLAKFGDEFKGYAEAKKTKAAPAAPAHLIFCPRNTRNTRNENQPDQSFRVFRVFRGLNRLFEMSSAPKPADLVTVNIDGKEIAVPKGTNVIEAAKLVGVEIPHYCYHPKLTIVGNCRMCLIEMGMPAVDPATKTPVMDAATGKQKINWIPRPQIGCGTNASPGLHIRTNTPMVKDCREGVTEMLLINHPLDCPICDQAGECKLQEHSTAYGRGYSRFVEQKNVKPKRTQLGPRVTLDDERCILCSRCVRFSKEIAKDDVLGFVDRGSYSTLTCYPGKQLENNYSLNTVDICPVGALTSTDFRFKMRVWFLKQTSSIDTESSVGVNTEVWSREGVLYRITPRRNDAVNDTWLADSGRILYKQVKADDRLTASTIEGTTSVPAAALARAGELLKAGSVAIVGSGRSSVEEQYLTKKLADTLKVSASLVSRVGQGDRLLISSDRNPNVRGALVTGLITALPAQKLTGLAADIDAGKVKTVVSIGEDLTAAGLTAAQLAKVSVIYLGTHQNATSAAAKVVIPTLTVFEKSGTFVNQQFRLQKFAKAVPGPAGVADDLTSLAELIAAAGGGIVSFELGLLWTTLAADVPALAGLSHAKLDPLGQLLDASAWAGLPFCEGETLHFKPAALPAAANA